MNKMAFQQSVIAGVLGGIIFAGLSFGTYYSGINSYFSFKAVYNFIPAVTILILVFGFNLRKKADSFISFKEVLQYAMVAFLIYEVFVAVTSYLLFIVIDPMLTEKLKNRGIEFAKEILTASGKSKDEINNELGKAQRQTETTGFKNIFLGFGMFLILDFMLSLLIAAIVKKDRPADLDFTPQTTLQ